MQLSHEEFVSNLFEDSCPSIGFAQNSTKAFYFSYHRFRWYATLENKTPAETFLKFPSVLRVIDRSDQNPPITAQ